MKTQDTQRQTIWTESLHRARMEYDRIVMSGEEQGQDIWVRARELSHQRFSELGLSND